jgi:hypothetical protein
VTDFLQSDTTPFSGIHLSFVYLSYLVLSPTLNEETKTAIVGFLKSRYATMYDDIHVLSFYLENLFVPARAAFRRCKVKAGEDSRNDASRCLAAAAALTRESTVAEQQEVQAAVITVCMGAPRTSAQSPQPNPVRASSSRTRGGHFSETWHLFVFAGWPNLSSPKRQPPPPVKGLSSSGRGCIRGFAIVSLVTTQTGHLPSCSTDNR